MFALYFLALHCFATEVTPVQKVVAMMTEMMEKGKAEKEAEATASEKYQSFCKTTARKKQSAIRFGLEDEDKFKAGIEKANADAEKFSSEIAQITADVGAWTSELKAATDVRAKELADFEAMHADMSDSLYALGKAISSLKKADSDVGATVLMQMMSDKKLPKEAQDKMHSFLQMNEDTEAPAGNAVEFQSGGIIEMMEGLEKKFEQERSDLETAEANKKHAFEMTSLDLNSNIDNGNDEIEKKEQNKMRRQQDSAEFTTSLQDTAATREEDQKYLAELEATCEQKATDFAARQSLRAEELQAIAKAIEIISGKAVSGAAQKHLPSLMQRKASLSQLFLSSTAPAQNQVADFLREKAEALDSRSLSFIASRVAADPLAKVRGMIGDLIKKLEEEAKAEAEHKAWCDGELKKNKHERDSKTQDVQSLSAQQESLEATIMQLTEEISDLNADLAANQKAMAEATATREAEHAKNEQTVADAKAAIVAVEEAQKVLKTFYDKASKATALAQGFADDAPATFDTPYKGMGGSSKGVMGMLEVIHSDFTRLEADTTSGEASAQAAYDEFKTTSEEDKAQLEGDIKSKGKEKVSKERDLQVTKEDLAGTQKMLGEADAYFKELSASCLEAKVDFKERAQQREEEIASLKEALEALN